jgi:hypothetical protein
LTNDLTLRSLSNHILCTIVFADLFSAPGLLESYLQICRSHLLNPCVPLPWLGYNLLYWVYSSECLKTQPIFLYPQERLQIWGLKKKNGAYLIISPNEVLALELPEPFILWCSLPAVRTSRYYVIKVLYVKGNVAKSATVHVPCSIPVIFRHCCIKNFICVGIWVLKIATLIVSLPLPRWISAIPYYMIWFVTVVAYKGSLPLKQMRKSSAKEVASSKWEESNTSLSPLIVALSPSPIVLSCWFVACSCWRLLIVPPHLPASYCADLSCETQSLCYFVKHQWWLNMRKELDRALIA